jgi:hypothetical protein
VTSAHDRMLAEGPRLAPQPPVASDAGSAAASRRSSGMHGSSVSRRGKGRVVRSAARKAWFPAVVALVAISGAARHSEAWILPIVLIGLVAVTVVRRR